MDVTEVEFRQGCSDTERDEVPGEVWLRFNGDTSSRPPRRSTGRVRPQQPWRGAVANIRRRRFSAVRTCRDRVGALRWSIFAGVSKRAFTDPSIAPFGRYNLGQEWGTMAKDHFIPAALLGRFSDAQSGRLRDRELRIVSKHTTPRTARATAVGYKKGLYDVDRDAFTTTQGRAIDNLWEAYEPKLPAVLDALIEGTLTASDWIGVLVPFVAANFARDRSYASRVDERLERQGTDDLRADFPWIFDKTNLNLNRVVEMNRFAARAIMCEWYVYEADGDLVIPDVGFGFDLMDPFEGKDVVALVFPVGRRHVLELVPRPNRFVAVQYGGKWQVPIAHERSAATAADLNKVLAGCAQNFVAGTEAATTTVSPDDMAIFDPAAIDEILGQWPFNVDTLTLAGIHAPLERLLRGEEVNLDEWLLDRFEGVVDLDPNIDFHFVRSAARAPASRFLSVTEAVVAVRAHVPIAKPTV